MDSCLGVEQDLDKATSKFNALNEHTNKVLEEIISQVEDLKNEISKQPPDSPLTQAQAMILSDLAANVKQTVFQMSTEHRELHATVSRVGKSIDRHFIIDYASVAPKAESFSSDTNRPIMEQAIAQHLYRQGLEEVGDVFVSEAGVTCVERTCAFALLQRCASALAAGDPAPALAWAQRRAHQLTHSPLPFALHTVQTLKVGREQGVGAAIEYARQQFPAHAARHERQLAAAVCALAWLTPGAGNPPPQYQRLLDPRALGSEAAELFVREACALLRLAPLSPLAGAAGAGARVLPALHDIRNKMCHMAKRSLPCKSCIERCSEAAELFVREACALLRLAPLSPLAGAAGAGARVLPALHDIRNKMCQQHVAAAWADDELPLEVELGAEGGGYHSVFACPILRQQASEQNPPMRLLCGHVISRDALNKLAMGVKLKCPYCPMEQSPSEARQIYFS
ncbi:Protein RMD5-like B [Papilio xuthus]|uniref:Protein RMD5-like B n=1 Tax=Papilio xuthus TaxID=66420 RepID=A0A194PI98_PAPXU|nr:Protein RMD5-like B [Papilio xuthus]